MKTIKLTDEQYANLLEVLKTAQTNNDYVEMEWTGIHDHTDGSQWGKIGALLTIIQEQQES